MEEQVIKCKRCNEYLVYEQTIQSPSSDVSSIKTYHCMNCGFVSNSLMKFGNEFYDKQMNALPELYKAIAFTDTDSFVWTPSTTNLHNQGMVFIDGKNKDDWSWAAIKAIKNTEEEKTKYPIPGKKDEYYEFRMDMTTLKHFGKEGYSDALYYIGVLTDDIVENI